MAATILLCNSHEILMKYQDFSMILYVRMSQIHISHVILIRYIWIIITWDWNIKTCEISLDFSWLFLWFYIRLFREGPESDINSFEDDGFGWSCWKRWCVVVRMIEMTITWWAFAGYRSFFFLSGSSIYLPGFSLRSLLLIYLLQPSFHVLCFVLLKLNVQSCSHLCCSLAVE